MVSGMSVDLISGRMPAEKSSRYRPMSSEPTGGLVPSISSIHPESLLLTVTSDNKDYSTYTDLKPDKLDIVGRVIWLGRRI